MKRSDALAELSRDHHLGLVAAQKLKRATAESAASARNAFLTFWADDGHHHFRVEEDVLLPAVAHRIDPAEEVVVRVLTDHVELRRRAADLSESSTATPVELNELGRRLESHIRHEERTLFPLIEATLSEEELAALVVAIHEAHG